MHNTGSFIIKIAGSYDTASAGDTLAYLEIILDNVTFATFTFTWFVLGDDDLCIEVFYHVYDYHDHQSLVETIYSTLRNKFTNVTVD